MILLEHLAFELLVEQFHSCELHLGWLPLASESAAAGFVLRGDVFPEDSEYRFFVSLGWCVEAHQRVFVGHFSVY